MTAVVHKTKTIVKDMMDAVQEKTARINVRLSVHQRQLLQEAAQLTGTSMSEFILVPAVERAAQVLASEQVTRLNSEVAERLITWLDEPAQVIPAMRRLVDAKPFDD